MRRHALSFRGPAAAALLGAVALAPPGAAQASCRMNVADFVGWQIIYAGQLSGTIDPNGRSETFGGCVPGRVLLIDDDRSVACTQTRLGSAYRPEIVVLSNGKRMVACIADALYDVRD
ncbi:hypothetical protein [uncultured Albimonas sp.]|uniref:hypothetical protein n=1 Tax=uncultured Albimonas sp. TaxID=1331701 RepID=UPI0030EC1898|tara:strand:+ start:2956 stop:3309 length:354 start_codon:yes stop_codon:yes gene_type:complete